MKWLIGLVLTAACGGGGFWWWNSAKGSGAATSSITDDGIFKVRKGDLPITLTENGTLVAK
jgi:hypothetical protein